MLTDSRVIEKKFAGWHWVEGDGNGANYDRMLQFLGLDADEVDWEQRMSFAHAQKVRDDSVVESWLVLFDNTTPIAAMREF